LPLYCFADGGLLHINWEMTQQIHAPTHEKGEVTKENFIIIWKKY